MHNDACGLELPKAWFGFFWFRISSGTGTGFNAVPDVDSLTNRDHLLFAIRVKRTESATAGIAQRVYALLATTKSKRTERQMSAIAWFQQYTFHPFTPKANAVGTPAEVSR